MNSATWRDHSTHITIKHLSIYQNLDPKPKLLMDYSKNSLGNFAIIALLIAGVLYICIWTPSQSNPLSPFQKAVCPRSNLTSLDFHEDELDLALGKASMPNKTVILTVVNKAYVEQSIDADTTMLDIFLESFWLGEDTRQLIDHLLVVAVDQTAYDRCMFKRLHCYRLVTDGVDFAGEKVYMSRDFIKMMWTRTRFLLDVLDRGYSFIFTDTDVMWLRNPFVMLSGNETVDEDLQISVDTYNGDPRSELNMINTGFYFIRSNNRTIALFDTWYGMKDNSTGKKEQDVLLELMTGGLFRKLGMRVRFLPTLFFSGFCEDSRDFLKVITVHSNCCRHIDAKVNDLRGVLRDWKRFKVAKARNETIITKWSGHNGCWDSWKS